MNANINIRLLTASDLPEVIAIDHEAFSPYGTTEDPDTFVARRDVFPRGFIVAELENLLVGYACSEKWLVEREPLIDEDPHDTHHPGGRILCITGMAVRPAHRQQRVGSALLQSLLRIAIEERCDSVLLETSNAQGFYEKHGFNKVAERQHNGTRLHIMHFHLSEIKDV